MTTPHGQVHTSAFLPIGTRGSVKAVTTEELKFWGAEMVLANTYHLWLRPGDLLIRKAGGLHKFMGWDGPIMTDSGGYQVFSMGEKRFVFSPSRREGGDEEGVREAGAETPSQSPPIRLGRQGEKVRVSDAGVEFRDELDGATHLLTPEESINIQANLGSDIALVLDDVPGLSPEPINGQATGQGSPPIHRLREDRLSKSLDLTLHWAERAKRAHKLEGQALYGIVQGGDSETLRKKSAEALRDLDFSGYGIGGLAVGEPPEVMYRVLDFTIPHLEEDKPRHLLGVGTPEQIIEAVARGIDTFDCVLPTRNARHGMLFVNRKAGILSTSSRNNKVSATKEGNVAEAFPPDGEAGRPPYDILNIGNAQYKDDFTPPDNTCACYLCLHHTRAYLRHLFATGEPLAIRLATMHNLRFYLDLMARTRRAIELGSFKEMYRTA